MRRLTFVFAHVLPAVAVLGLLITDRAMAQTTPPPSLPAIVAPVPATPPDSLLPPSIQRGVSPATAPPVLPPGRAQGRQGQPGQQGQQGQGQQGQPPGRSLGTQPPQAI